MPYQDKDIQYLSKCFCYLERRRQEKEFARINRLKKAREWREANIERIGLMGRNKKSSMTPEQYEKKIKRDKAYRDRNKDVVSKKNWKYREANRDKINSIDKIRKYKVRYGEMWEVAMKLSELRRTLNEREKPKGPSRDTSSKH